MRKRICLSISILAVSLLAPCQAGAQQARETASADSTRLFEGVSVGVDLLGAGQCVLSDYGQYEASLRLNLRGRYFPVVELGIGEADADDVTTSVRYKTRAPYGRVGCDFNLLRNKHDLYRLYAGARLAYTSFHYDVTTSAPVPDPVWGGTASYSATDVEAKACWAEVCGGIDVTIWRFVHMGWMVRYRARLSQSHGTVGEPYYIPGFGRNGSSRIGATFNLSFEL